jgi:hypothetical protein
MKASPWEIEDAQAEDIPIINNHVPKAFVHEDGKLLGMAFDQVEVVYDDAWQAQSGPHRRGGLL